MRQPGVSQAITAYAIPPHAPPEVAEAKSKFDAIATSWADTKGELQDAVEALPAAKEADLRAIVTMAEQGKSVRDAQVHRRKAEVLITDLRVRLKGLDRATDEAGNRLAEAISQHRDQWLPRLAEAEADATVRFDEAITQARSALADLRPARGAVEWLQGFDAAQAQAGECAQFAGGRLRVQSRGGVLKGVFDPTLLLDLAARVTAEEETQTVTVKGKVPAHV